MSIRSTIYQGLQQLDVSHDKSLLAVHRDPVFVCVLNCSIVCALPMIIFQRMHEASEVCVAIAVLALAGCLRSSFQDGLWRIE